MLFSAGFMLSNFEDTIYLAAPSKLLKQYWIDRIQQVIKKLKADAKLEDKPILLNAPKPVSLETRMEQYRSSVRRRKEKEAGLAAQQATSERASAKRVSAKATPAVSRKPAVGTAAARRGAGQGRAVPRRGGRRKQVVEEEEEGSAGFEEDSESGSLPGKAVRSGGRKKFRYGIWL